jgi:hypothetical protein
MGMMNWSPRCLENPGLVKVATRNSPSIAAASHEAITIYYNDITMISFEKRGKLLVDWGLPKQLIVFLLHESSKKIKRIVK